MSQLWSEIRWSPKTLLNRLCYWRNLGVRDWMEGLVSLVEKVWRRQRCLSAALRRRGRIDISLTNVPCPFPHSVLVQLLVIKTIRDMRVIINLGFCRLLSLTNYSYHNRNQTCSKQPVSKHSKRCIANMLFMRNLCITRL